MDEAVESGRGRWSTAVALAILVLVLSVFDPVALVAIPLAMLVIGLPTERRLFWGGVGFALWLVALVLPGGLLQQLSRGWALVLGLMFLTLTLLRPGWPVVMRALGSTGAALLAGGVAMAFAGGISGVDDLVRSHLDGITTLLFSDLERRAPGAAWIADLRVTSEQLAERQVYLFPAYLALQSVAALALSAWWVRRLGRAGNEAFRFGALREFRFNDQLVWVLILGIVLLLLPPQVARLGVNLVAFMAALYTLRGFAVFVFLASESGSVLTIVLGVVALLVLYPLVFTAALLVGLGDTWLDVRRRVSDAART